MQNNLTAGAAVILLIADCLIRRLAYEEEVGLVST